MGSETVEEQMMPDGLNGPGFSSREEAARYHEARMKPRPTQLDYQFGPRPVREALPPSPLDGEQTFRDAQATEQGQQAAMDKFLETENPQPVPEVVTKPLPQIKSLKEIAMERGHIPRKG